jgi:hypothetical protein
MHIKDAPAWGKVMFVFHFFLFVFFALFCFSFLLPFFMFVFYCSFFFRLFLPLFLFQYL